MMLKEQVQVATCEQDCGHGRCQKDLFNFDFKEINGFDSRLELSFI